MPNGFWPKPPALGALVTPLLPKREELAPLPAPELDKALAVLVEPPPPNKDDAPPKGFTAPEPKVAPVLLLPKGDMVPPPDMEELGAA